MAGVGSRVESSAGFYITFDVPRDVPSLPEQMPSVKPAFRFGDVKASIRGLDAGAGFLAWVEDGYLKQLEGYTYGEAWSPNVAEYSLEYINGSRDIARLQREWTKAGPSGPTTH